MKNLREYILNENNFFKNLGIGQETLIKDWLEKYCNIRLGKYTINPDMTIDVDGAVIINSYPEKEFPDYIQFGEIKYGFSVLNSDKLETLRGCPRKCKNFSCDSCKKLKSLEYSPIECEKFSCSHCHSLETLRGCSQKCDKVNCQDCSGLTSLEGLEHYKFLEELNCSYCNNLTSLKGIPKKCFDLDCSNCPKLMSLEYAPKSMMFLRCRKCGGCFTIGYLIRNDINPYRYEVDIEKLVRK